MLKGFEDAFVDVQASVISLCLELLSNSGRTAEKIYVYLYQNNDIDYIITDSNPDFNMSSFENEKIKIVKV